MTRNDRDEQKAARRRQQQTGEPYQDALSYIRSAWQRLDHDLRYVLSDDVQAYMRGEGWRGLPLDQVEDMRAWLANRTPTYECEWCGEDGDARTEDTSMQLVVAAYDPDLSPVTGQIASKRHHARCQPSKLVQAQPVDIPRGPRAVALPASARPEVEAEIAISVQPVWVPEVLDFEPKDPDDPHSGTEPALLVTVAVTDDRGQGEGSWLTELELSVWRPARFNDLMANAQAGPGWSVRVVEGYPSSLAPQWVAVRMTPPEEGREPHHLYVGALDAPEAWSQALRGRERLLLLAGPLQMGGAAPEIPEKVDPDQLAELLEEDAVLAAYVPLELDVQDHTPAPEQRTFWSTANGLMG
ncbi:hypothetical protein [Nonomuraea sp. LPB2021202275-12-8]|uniref:hypothetical protein n=1 Tax=Nonomuraea sp. LPB2021202275-12-8 TaxID=3120159 RepID=UPI00300CBD0A